MFALLPSGADYEQWRSWHDPPLEGVLRVLDEQQLEWDGHQKQCLEAVKARGRGLVVRDPVPPSEETSVFSILRLRAPISAERRAETVRECGALRRPLPGKTASIADIVQWIVGEAMARGIGSDFDTAYQVWFVAAELLLRDADIGAIIARVHPERLGRLKSSGKIDQEIQNAALARQERKRVNAKRLAFGYPAA